MSHPTFPISHLLFLFWSQGDPTRGNTSTLLTEVHVRLLRALLADAPALRERQRLPSASDGLLLQQLAPPSIVTVGNWQEVLRSTLVLLLEAEAEEGLQEALSSLRSTEYSALAPSHKLCLLSALCGAYSEAPSTAALLFERERKQLERIGELPRTWRHLHDASLAPVAPPQEDVDSASVYSERCHGWIVLNQHHTPQDAELGPNVPPCAASTTPRPSEAATATLLEAIAARSASALATAIADAEAPAGGHVGIFQTTPQLARRWWTIELRRAHELLQELNREKMRNLKMRALAERQVGAFCDHLVSLAGGQTREEPIGVDSSGRRYWFFAADATRLWVEMPPPAAGEAASAVGWRYYSTQRELKCLLQHLAGSATLPTWEDAASDACVASWQALATTPATQMYLPAGVGGGYCPYARGDAELLRSLAIRLPIIAKVNLSLSTTPPPTPPLRASDIPPYLPAFNPPPYKPLQAPTNPRNPPTNPLQTLCRPSSSLLQAPCETPASPLQRPSDTPPPTSPLLRPPLPTPPPPTRPPVSRGSIHRGRRTMSCGGVRAIRWLARRSQGCSIKRWGWSWG